MKQQKALFLDQKLLEQEDRVAGVDFLVQQGVSEEKARLLMSAVNFAPEQILDAYTLMKETSPEYTPELLANEAMFYLQPELIRCRDEPCQEGPEMPLSQLPGATRAFQLKGYRGSPYNHSDRPMDALAGELNSGREGSVHPAEVKSFCEQYRRNH